MQSFKNMVAGSAALVAAFVTVAAATPLRAEPVRVAVAYGDLDIQSQVGAAELQTRIARAARRACGPSDAASHFQVARCRTMAVESAQSQLAMKANGIKLAAR
ncbi:UrcA family protein [Sphingomonas sp. Root710]|uniref:UrcA family protein n=1 Tax=Sphingomonas sp. Root710 TaxID=1736594 RepID=UPI0006F30516|nr:UrcA family protein [Sphingomonas sp. Root710]KRB86334.1 UrcA family protein [Sphingomonas sp. Root710]